MRGPKQGRSWTLSQVLVFAVRDGIKDDICDSEPSCLPVIFLEHVRRVHVRLLSRCGECCCKKVSVSKSQVPTQFSSSINSRRLMVFGEFRSARKQAGSVFCFSLPPPCPLAPPFITLSFVTIFSRAPALVHVCTTSLGKGGINNNKHE